MKTFSSLLTFAFLFSGTAFAQNKDLRFSKACEEGTSVTISAVGDLLLHGGLQRQAYSNKDGFTSLWSEVLPYLEEADISYANLEGPVADGVQCNGRASQKKKAVVGRDCRKTGSSVYTSYPRFNYHSRLVKDLLDSGFDIVSTANNHSLDRFSRGADSTIEILDQEGLPFTGTRESLNQDRPWHRLTTVKGKTIAWLSCTYGTNGIPDKKKQVLHCFRGGEVARIIGELKNISDAVIVTPHWGYEYQLKPNKRQRQYAQSWLDAGAAAVIGAHPHVVQPWEKYITKDGRETFVIYSLGNFVSGQSSFNKKATLVLFLGLTFPENGEAWVNGVRYAPAFMSRKGKTRSLLVSSIFKSSLKKKLLRFLQPFFGKERIVLPGEKVITNAECE